MRQIKRIALLMTLLLFFPSVSVPAGNPLIVIANSHFPKDQVSVSYLKKVYLGKKKHEGAYKVIPYDYKDNNPSKAVFIGKVMAATLGRYNAYWLKQQFREGNTPPATLNNPEAMLSTISKIHGAIGYMKRSDFKKHSGIKVLLVLE